MANRLGGKSNGKGSGGLGLIYTTFFYLSTNFHNLLLFFSCCSAELKSVAIFKISLSAFKLCQKLFFRILYLT